MTHSELLPYENMALEGTSQSMFVDTGTLITVGVLAVAGYLFYINATNCWFKPVGKMPGYCLTVFNR